MGTVAYLNGKRVGDRLITEDHLELRAGRSFCRNAIEICIYRGVDTALHPDGTFKQIDPVSMIPPIAGVLDMNAAQQLADDLYAAGIRPTEAAGSAGALSATQKHLDDMRKLVFDSQVKRASE